MSVPSVMLGRQGQQQLLQPGDLIGRSVAASCRLDDPHVSEAHAMLSLRGDTLRLLSLRGPLLIDGLNGDDFPLSVGQEVAFTEALRFTVQAVQVPDALLAVQVGAHTWPLRARYHALLLSGQRPQLVAYETGDAEMSIWSTARGWSMRLPGGASRAVRPGQDVTLGSHTVRFVTVQLSALKNQTTLGGFSRMTLAARGVEVELRYPHAMPITIRNQPGKLLSELALIGGPAPWRVVAQELWRGEADDNLLRKKWDRVRARLKVALREANIRDDLVVSDGRGEYKLNLHPGERVVDES